MNVIIMFFNRLIYLEQIRNNANSMFYSEIKSCPFLWANISETVVSANINFILVCGPWVPAGLIIE